MEGFILKVNSSEFVSSSVSLMLTLPWGIDTLLEKLIAATALGAMIHMPKFKKVSIYIKERRKRKKQKNKKVSNSFIHTLMYINTYYLLKYKAFQTSIAVKNADFLNLKNILCTLCLGIGDFIQSLSSSLISLVVTCTLMLDYRALLGGRRATQDGGTSSYGGI